MRVSRLTLRDFRNVKETVFFPDPGLNFLVGANGQGKTSLLESLGYLSSLRSFRGSKSDEVVRFGQPLSEIACELSPNRDEDKWITELKVVFSVSENTPGKVTKIALINGKPIRNSTQYLCQRFGNFELGFHSVVFNPSDHDLVRGEPAIRRSYLDRVLAAENIEYLNTLQKYKRVLEQRNAVLREANIPQPDLLLGFTEPLCRYGAFIVFKRLEWIKRVNEHLNGVTQQIAPDQPCLRFFYLSNWVPQIDNLCLINNDLGPVHFTGQGSLPSLELLDQSFWKKLATIDKAEWRSKHSLVGPHRDDWGFFQGEQVLKGHGSQGEIRTALLALKLSEIELFRKATGHRPLFLLDDFSSELDRDRRSFLLRFLNETDLQVFVTTTDESFFAGKRFWVLNGSLRESRNDRIESARE